MISLEVFKKLFPENKEPQAWVDAINEQLPGYNIDTKLRLAMFLAQCGHESNGFTAVKENLNYSATALIATWPKRFPQEIANQYARQPERIANRAYANRMGNGPEESGDGWKHRGLGPLQITGKTNQSAFARSVGLTVDAAIEYLKTPAGGIAGACWFWKNNALNFYAVNRDIEAATRKINGGLNGLADRERLYNRAILLLS